MTWIAQNLWLIPTLPLLAAALSALMKQRHRTLAASLAIGSMVLAFVLACVVFVSTLGGHGTAMRQVHNFDWFVLGETSLQLGWTLDPLTAAMLVMVTFVGGLIFIYSVGYMAHDENFTRFFCFLALFAAAMLGVVIANSLLLLFICWELVGFTSYLLIGFWYHKPSAAAAAKKAFITTRIGDIGFFLGILWLYSQTGTLVFYDDNGGGCLQQSALTKLIAQTTLGGMTVSTAIALLIFCGAVGKSGQVPLHVWLPDAMEGPTPVSALIHAATMVAAGVFLVARVYPLMEAVPPVLARPATVAQASSVTAPGTPLSRQESTAASTPQTLGGAMPPEPALNNALSPSTALRTVTWIGAITAVFAALIAVAQTDIKRILAYSTVSQLGYMMMGLGVGGVAVGMFHLITHAFFKALLFLGAGSVIHGCHEEQDIRRMGGLRKFMPVTFATYAVGMMALSGVPLFFSGFWSKDEILHAARGWNVSHWPFYLGLAGVLLTAFYMTRQICFVFFGQSRAGVSPVLEGQLAHVDTMRGATGMTDENFAPSPADLHPGQAGRLSYVPHESPRVMTMPLAVLAVCTILLSVFGTPAWPWFQSYLSGAPAKFDLGKLFQGEVLSVMILSALIMGAGVGLGWWWYGRQPVQTAGEADVLERRWPDVFALLRNKFYIDELYEASVVRFNARWARLCDWLDTWIWNGAVQLVSYLFLGLSWLNRFFDEYVINPGFDQGCGRVSRGGKLISSLQNGQVQNYLRVIGVALTVLVLILIWGCRRS
ncbi:MAG: proton-conducting transporter membrane subunit [Verrucomicrobiota bacterium]